MNDSPPSVLQLRVVIEADDFDDALAFYRDALGLSETAAFATGGDDRVAILEVGRATSNWPPQPTSEPLTWSRQVARSWPRKFGWRSK